LSIYGKAHGMQVNTDQASKISDLELVNLLGVSLPFHPASKPCSKPRRSSRENMLIDLPAGRRTGGQRHRGRSAHVKLIRHI
jgi:hypothetical protein